MTETVLGGEEDLSNRLKDSYPYRGDGTGRSEPVTIGGIKIRSDSDASDLDSTSSKDGNSKRKSFFTQPRGTLEYRVMSRDTLDSIALSFDSSPSQLMRLNHLTSRMIFPGQVLYVPDPDAEVPLSPILSSPTSTTAPEPVEPPKTLDIPTVSMKPRDVPTVSQGPPPAASTKKGRGISGRSFSLRRSFTRDHSDPKARPPLQKAVSMPQPGHAIRQQSVEWDTDDSRQYLKIDVKYITDGEGVVSGTMLVTPNAIMFDPNVSDPLVKDRGAGPYGVMTNMDQVLGAAMYHDISAMSVKTPSADEKEKPCCPVYVPEKEERHKGSMPGQTNNSTGEGKNGVVLAHDIRKRLTGCSAENPAEKDKDTHSKDTAQSQSAGSSSPSSDPTRSERTESNKGDVVESPDNKTTFQTQSSQEGNVLTSGKDSEVDESQSDSQREQSGGEEEGVCPTTLGYERLQSPVETDQGTKRFSSDVAESELSAKNAKRTETGQAGSREGDVTDGRRMRRVASDDSEKSLEAMDREMEEQLLLNSSDDRLDETCQDDVQTPSSEALPSPDATSTISGKDTAGDESRSGKSRSSERTEGCPGQCGKSESADAEETKERSNSQDFVDFSSGIFVNDCRKCSLVPDVKECIHAQEDDERKLQEVREEGQMIRQHSGEDKPDDSAPSEASDGAASVKVNGEANNNASDTANATDGGTDEKPSGVHTVNHPPSRELEYNKTNFREFLPKKAKPYEDPPLYLCIRTKKPMTKTFSAKQHHKFRKNKVPEYWFAIPRVKADNLYAFFLQWSPDLYGKELSPSEVGFVVVQDSQESEELELIEDFFKEPIHKDWEIITREEASKRRMTILECELNLPLPELIGESTLLCNDYVRKLAKNLPPRTEGYSWVLIFNTSTHGYSLASLYRNMAGWESPILLILRDSEGHLFGALTNCALKVSDHYYGTGESFLYRFREEELETYRWTGENNFFMKGDMDSICIGGGEGDFGLWLDGDLYHGRSHPCKTFGNETLSASEDFVIADMEAWGFNT